MRELLSRGVQARRSGDFDEARRLLSEALEAAAADPLAEALVLRELGELARNQDQRAEAVQFYQQAVARLRQAQADTLLLAHTIRHLGDVSMENGQTNPAGEWLREALALYEEHKAAPPLDVANALRSVAVHCETTGANEEAYALWSTIRARYSELGIEAGVEESTRRLRRLDMLR